MMLKVNFPSKGPRRPRDGEEV